MARGDQLGRQWKIIQRLLAARRGKTVAALAADLDCHPRTVYRDLEALETAGFPVYTEKIGGVNHWSLLDSLKQQIPLPLSLTELTALYFSRDMLKMLRDTVFYDALETLFQKIKATLPPAYGTYLERVEQSLQVGPTPHKAYGRYKELIEQVNAAALERRYVDITYFTMSRRRETRRRVAPYKIWFVDGTFYLIGFCTLRGSIRLFAVDRIRAIETAAETFEMPADFDVEHFMRSSFGVFRGEPVTVRLRFAPAVAGYVSEKTWHATQRIAERPDGGIDLSMEVAGIEEVMFWILSWGGQVEVLAPPSLRAAVHAEAACLLEKHAPDRPPPNDQKA